MHKKISLYYYYIASYLIICLIPSILIGIILMTGAVGTVRREVEKVNFSRLEQSMNVVDQRLQEFMNVVYQISSDARLVGVDVGTYGRYDLLKLTEVLNYYRKTNLLLDDICLYYANKGLILSSTDTMNLQTFNNTYKLSGGTRWEVMQKNTQGTLNVLVEKVVSVKNDTEGIPELAFLFPISSSYNDNILVAIFVREQTFTNLISNISGDYSGISAIFDYNKRLLVTSAKDFNIQPDQLQGLVGTTGDRAIQEMRLDGQKISMIHLRSTRNRYTYLTVIPSDQFWQQADYLQKLIIVVISIAILIGIVFSLFFARGIYKPIRKLADYLGSRTEEKTGLLPSNELEQIRSSVEEALNRNDAMAKRIEEQKNVYEERLLVKLLNGKAGPEEQLLLDPQKEGYDFCVFLIEISQIVRLELQQIAVRLMDLEQDRHLSIRFIELPERESITAIASYLQDADSKNPEDAKAYIKKLAELLRSTFMEDTGYTVYISCGNAVGSFHQVNRSFVEASAAMEYKILWKDKQVFFFEDISHDGRQHYAYPREEQIRLIHAVSQGNAAVAGENVKAITAYLSRQTMSLLMARYICFDIINGLVKAIVDMNAGDFSRQIENLMQFTSVEDLEDRLNKLITDVCTVIGREKELKLENRKKFVLAYIEEYFREHWMSLEHVADVFKLQPFYMSRLIKEAAGQSFTDYLTALRINYIKTQLLETEHTMKEIIQDAGYIDHASFIRRFKQLEGCTPGQYRERMKHGR